MSVCFVSSTQPDLFLGILCTSAAASHSCAQHKGMQRVPYGIGLSCPCKQPPCMFRNLPPALLPHCLLSMLCIHSFLSLLLLLLLLLLPPAEAGFQACYRRRSAVHSLLWHTPLARLRCGASLLAVCRDRGDRLCARLRPAQLRNHVDETVLEQAGWPAHQRAEPGT